MKLSIIVLFTLGVGLVEGIRFPRQAESDASDVFFNQRHSYFDNAGHDFNRREIADDENEVIADDAENEIIDIDDNRGDDNYINNDHDDENDDDDNDDDDDDDGDDRWGSGDGTWGSGDGNWGSGDGTRGSGDDTWGIGDHFNKVDVTEIFEEKTEVTIIQTEEPKKYETGEHVCSEEYSKRCTDVMLSIEKLSDITEDFCIGRKGTEECLSNILEHCVDDEDEKVKAQIFIELLKEVLDDVCQGNHKSNDSFRDSSDCIQSNDRLKHGTESCAEFAQAGLEEMKIENDNDLTDEDYKCLSMHLLIECLMEIATEECGEEAAKLLEVRLKSEIGKELEASSSYYCAPEIDENEGKKRK